jgi:hypothetical protein
MFNEHSTIVASKAAISANLADEAVLLDPDSGMYYGLNEVGSQVWELIQEPKMVNEIRDALLAEYEVEPERCQQDLLALLQNLIDKGLIKINNGSDS